MKIGICSFSFHRSIAVGDFDVFGYIDLCVKLGCTQLDPWNAHLSPPQGADSVLRAGQKPSESHQLLGDVDSQFIDRVAEHADRAGIPCGTLAIDGVHIYEPTEEARNVNRQRAYRWLEAAAQMGATQVRIDGSGPEEMPDDVFNVIIDGYRDLIARAKPLGIEVLIENHWGPSVIPENIVRILEAAPGLGLLYDTRNWPPDRKRDGRRIGARYARATHVKTKRWDQNGNEPDEDIATGVKLLGEAGYSGTWGIESVPDDGDEIGSASRTIELLRRLVENA